MAKAKEQQQRSAPSKPPPAGSGAAKRKATNALSLSGQQAPLAADAPLTVDSLKHQLASHLAALAAQLDGTSGNLQKLAVQGEASVHKRAKIDHAAASKVLEDAASSIALARKQHSGVIKEVQRSAKEAQAQTDAGQRSCANALKEVLGSFQRDVAAVKHRHNIKG